MCLETKGTTTTNMNEDSVGDPVQSRIGRLRLQVGIVTD